MLNGLLCALSVRECDQATACSHDAPGSKETRALRSKDAGENDSQQQKAAPDSATESARTTSSAQDSVVIYTGHEVGPRLLQQDAAELPEEQADEAEASETPPVAKAARTPEELRDALAAGTQHIVIKSHLDLTVLEKVDDGLGNQLALAPLPTTVKSITGDCRVTPRLRDFNLFAAQTQLLDIKSRQCLVVTDSTFVSTTSKLWLSKLYVRLTGPAADSAILYAGNGSPLEWPKPVFVRASGADGGLWMTEVTLQGDGLREAEGLDAATAVLAQDCTFSRLGGSEPAISVRGDGTTAAFNDSKFLNNVEFDSGEVNVMMAASGATAMWLEGCTFTDNAAQHDVGDSGTPARIFSDQPLTILHTEQGTTRSSEELESKPGSIQFLNTSDPWILTAQEEIASSASSMNYDWFPGPLGVWSFAAILMGVAAIVIGIVVYFLPAPPKTQSPSIRRGLHHTGSLHDRYRAEYLKTHSSSSHISRTLDRERGSSRLAKSDSRVSRVESPTVRESRSTPRRSPTFVESTGASFRSRSSPMHPQRISERGTSFMDGSPNPTNEPVETDYLGTGAPVHSPLFPPRGENTDRLSGSTHNSSITFGRDSATNIRRVDSRLGEPERVTSSGSGGRVSVTRTTTADSEYPDDGERDLLQEQIDLAMRNLQHTAR